MFVVIGRDMLQQRFRDPYMELFYPVIRCLITSCKKEKKINVNFLESFQITFTFALYF